MEKIIMKAVKIFTCDVCEEKAAEIGCVVCERAICFTCRVIRKEVGGYGTVDRVIPLSVCKLCSQVDATDGYRDKIKEHSGEIDKLMKNWRVMSKKEVLDVKNNKNGV